MPLLALAEMVKMATGSPSPSAEHFIYTKPISKLVGAISPTSLEVRAHLYDALANKRVALLTARDLRQWRDGLAKHLAPASVNRSAGALKAALNLVADHDERIASRQPWDIGLATIPDAEESRNVILPETVVHAIIREAYLESVAFGLLVEIAAVTGAPSQSTRKTRGSRCPKRSRGSASNNAQFTEGSRAEKDNAAACTDPEQPRNATAACRAEPA